MFLKTCLIVEEDTEIGEADSNVLVVGCGTIVCTAATCGSEGCGIGRGTEEGCVVWLGDIGMSCTEGCGCAP